MYLCRLCAGDERQLFHNPTTEAPDVRLRDIAADHAASKRALAVITGAPTTRAEQTRLVGGAFMAPPPLRTARARGADTPLLRSDLQAQVARH